MALQPCATAADTYPRLSAHHALLADSYDPRNDNHKTDDPRINPPNLVRRREDIQSVPARSNVTIASPRATIEAECKRPLRKVRLRKIRIQNTQPVFVQP